MGLDWAGLQTEVWGIAIQPMFQNRTNNNGCCVSKDS